MCNLYRMTKPNSEVARWFDAIDQLGGANFGEEVFPGYPGVVVADGGVASETSRLPVSECHELGSRGSRTNLPRNWQHLLVG